jgi:hypothetical protein
MATKAIFVGINKHVDPTIPELVEATRVHSLSIRTIGVSFYFKHPYRMAAVSALLLRSF